MPRWVTGMPASAGAAVADVTPGTISNGTPASASASASSPPRPSTNGSPALSRTTRRPARASATIRSLTCFLRDRLVADPLRDRNAIGRRRQIHNRPRHESVIQHEIGRAQPLDRAIRQELRIARAGADNRHEADPAGGGTWRDRALTIAASPARAAAREPGRAPQSPRRVPAVGPASARPFGASAPSGRRHAETSVRDRPAAAGRGLREAVPANAGARPLVEMAIVAPARRTTPPRYAVACAGSSAAFTNTRRRLAARSTARLTCGGAAATTNHTPARSDARNARRRTRTPDADDGVCDVRRHDGDARAGVDERANLRRRNRSTAHDQHGPAGQLEEHGEDGVSQRSRKSRCHDGPRQLATATRHKKQKAREPISDPRAFELEPVVVLEKSVATLPRWATPFTGTGATITRGRERGHAPPR